jgi:hypothetical protein
MVTNTDIEGYLIQMGMKFEALKDGTWVIHDEYDQIDNIVVRHESPILLCRVKLMDLPVKGDLTGLYRTLLELNANEMLGAAYGIEGDAIVATDTLQSENLDLNEFQAAIDGLSLCISDHYQQLNRFRSPEEKATTAGPGP